MRDRRIFLACPFGDYEGVRAYLDRLAQEGWALTARAGLLCGRLEPSRREELYYDVLPAPPWRSRAQLQREVEARRAEGWEPVDTVWGMDIYRSMPCRYPTLSRTGETFAALRAAFALRLVRVAVLLAAALSALARAGLLGWDIVKPAGDWYLHDFAVARTLLLPPAAALWGLYCLWLAYCVLFRCRPHGPAGRAGMCLHGAAQLLRLACTVLLAAAAWTEAVPRVWIRLVLLALLALLLWQSWRLGWQAAAAGAFALLMLTVFLQRAVPPVRYEIGTGSAPLSAEALGWEENGACSGEYGEEASVLVRKIGLYQRWDSGAWVQVDVYRALMPQLAAWLEQNRDEAGTTLRRGRRVYCIEASQPLSGEAVEGILARMG